MMRHPTKNHRLPLLIGAFLVFSACVPAGGDQDLLKNDNNYPNHTFASGRIAVNAVKTKSLNETGNTGKLKTGENESLSDFAAAADRNRETEKSLRWLFGKKPQIGWYLYKPLIAEEIGVELNAPAAKFAEALARWQKSRYGDAANGILDEGTLFDFLGEWQKRRLFARGVAESKELVIAPPSDFYDSGRDEALRHVDRETYDAYLRMVRAAAADLSLKLKSDKKGKLAPDERFLKIISAFRTREYQEKLRAASPKSGTAGLAVNSPHFTGRALDIYVGGDPVSTVDANRAVQIDTPVYQWLVKNAGKFGFRPYFYEPWHWEYVPD